MSRVALVTGAGHGLGRVIAAALHRVGYRVALGDLDAAAADEGAHGLDPSGGTAIAVSMDVREKAGFERALAIITERWGGADVLVNNAAATAAKPLMDITADEFDAVMAVNVRGTFLGSQVFGAHFQGRGHGRIVNMASLAGQNGGTATGAHYAASKGAIVTLTKVFARDLAPHGVTVNAVAPGPLDTPAVHRTVPPERMPALLAAIPVAALGDPTFVAGLVVQLASPEAGFATGATWDVNGGLYLR
ncbi:MAG TPA: SDR family oxidoreductase [Acetobacteraceae bacterium]